MELYNADRQITERIGQIYILNGRDRATVEELSGGDIGAVVKLKDTHTGNTLCAASRPVKLAKVQYPQPTIHASLAGHGQGRGGQSRGGHGGVARGGPDFSLSGRFGIAPDDHFRAGRVAPGSDR